MDVVFIKNKRPPSFLCDGTLILDVIWIKLSCRGRRDGLAAQRTLHILLSIISHGTIAVKMCLMIALETDPSTIILVADAAVSSLLFGPHIRMNIAL
jgi:hypothetical protein